MKTVADFYNKTATGWSDEWYKEKKQNEILRKFYNCYAQVGTKHPRILDLGCGAGYDSKILSKMGARVVGLDVSQKLIKIAKILSAFPENDLLISGHTALAGNAQSRQKLSEERASAVAEFLIDLGIKDSHHIFTQGFGATKPIAPNTNTEGMARNRRVEITIMEK